MSNVTYYFEIGGMTCTGCSNTIKSVLEKERFVRDKVDINLATHRARLTIEEGTDPNRVVQSIKDLGFDARLLTPQREEVLYYAIAGLKDPKEANDIAEKLNKIRAYIKSCEVNYSTNTVTITTFVSSDPAKRALLVRQIQRDIQSAVQSHQITVTPIKPPAEQSEQGGHPRLFYRKALINAIAILPWMLLSSLIPPPVTLFGQAIGLLIGGLTLGVMWKTGKEFYVDAFEELVKRRSSNMNSLIALGTGSAWLYSMVLICCPWLFPVAALQYQFLAVNMILLIVNFGKGLRAQAQEKAKEQSQSLAQVIARLQPQYVKRCKFPKDHALEFQSCHAQVEEIPYADICEGDIIKVNVHERFPVEGIILNDVETFVNQETLTGESKACNKKKGDEVFSGSLNTKNTVYIRATCKGKDSHLSRVIDDVAKSSGSKTSISKIVDKLAVVFVPIIVSLSGLTALGWYLFGPVPQLAFMIKSAMSVLLCACPCTILLATPLSTHSGICKLFLKGILVHNAAALEAAAQIDTVVFDKTGTLTTPVIAKVFVDKSEKDWTSKSVLQYVASLEHSFDHPIAKSFEKSYVNENSMTPFYKTSAEKKDEHGISGIVNSKEVIVGNLSHLESRGIAVPASYKKEESEYAKIGMTSVFVSIDKKCVAVFGLKHKIREDAKKAIEDLQKMNIDVFMLTGDEHKPALAVAEKLGIGKVYANHNSEMKEKFIADLQKTGRVVAMVGDGVNDYKPIRKADVGIALGPWTNASATADIALQNLNIPTMLIIAKQTMRNIRQNLWWTGFYNIISIIAASGLLYPFFGVVLNPVIASMLMAVSSIFVVLNSSRLAYQIDEAVDRYEGKLPQPTTFFQKIVYFFSLNSLIQTLQMLIFFESDATRQAASAESAGGEVPDITSSPARKRPILFSSPSKKNISKVINVDELFDKATKEATSPEMRLPRARKEIVV